MIWFYVISAVCVIAVIVFGMTRRKLKPLEKDRANESFESFCASFAGANADADVLQSVYEWFVKFSRPYRVPPRKSGRSDGVRAFDVRKARY